MTEKEYASLVSSIMPHSQIRKNCLWAFLTGGLICTLGQALIGLFKMSGLSAQDASLCASITLVFLSALLTGLSLYDDMARYAGAGTLVPITGFANAISAAAIEFKTDAGVIIGPSHKGPLLREYMMI